MLKPILSALILWLFIYLSFSVQAVPQTTSSENMQGGTPSSSSLNSSSQSNNQDTNQVNKSPLTQLGSEYHNSIKLLQNRFRIDYKVAEITMIFFRDFGSAPVVLVQPDGSKIYISDAEDEDIFWFDSSTYDMISIKDPMPGPWQAVGQISSESQVMVISDLALQADSLPQIIFSGEILKQTAYLTNNDIPIDYAAFRDVVELSISLSSTNNPNLNNFGAETEVIALFEDNGKGMDEKPLDGIFTGRFNLAIADGEWIPTFTVTTPMFTRKQVDPTLMLLANPIKVDVELDKVGGGYHKIIVDAEREHVDMSTLLIDGKIRSPNGDIQNFSITDRSAVVREHLIVNYEYGVYRVKLTVYGDTIDGREFILDVPEYSFLSEEPEQVIATDVAEVKGPSKANDAADVAEKSVMPIQVLPLAEEKMSTSRLVFLIIGINLFILVIGGGLIYWLTSDNKLTFNFMKKFKKIKDRKDTDMEDDKDDDGIKGRSIEDTDKKVGFLAKIFKRKPKKQNS
jgi:uncharacterized protein (TIGR03503 family)